MEINRKVAIALTLLLGSGFVSQAIAKKPKPKPNEPLAVIEWSMAERTVGIKDCRFMPELEPSMETCEAEEDRNRHGMILGPDGEPGLYGGVASVPLDQINPQDGYKITLNGCESEGEIKQYRWRIDGKRVPAKATDCIATTRLPEGSYVVELEVKNKGKKDKVTREIDVKDYLVVIMGDSYSSGEGNATYYVANMADSDYESTVNNNGQGFSETGFWDDANCHRSTRAGQANAAIDLEESDPHTSVTTLFLACSGAQIDKGILGTKIGYLEAEEKPQAYRAWELAINQGRDIDALLFGIGGNDIGFVPIVAEGVVQADTFLSTTESPTSTDTPILPFIGDPVNELDIPDLLLTLGSPPPSPLLRQLQDPSLHACDSRLQRAVLGEGDIGPDEGQTETCRTGIGYVEDGLADVNRCFTGDRPGDCRFARSYYVFDVEDENYSTWLYPTAAATGIEGLPEQWPGLGIAPDRIFHTEYPDLTTFFADDNPDGEIEFCEIGIKQPQLLFLLGIIEGIADNPFLIRQLIRFVENNVAETAILGLGQNEFRWASESVLNGQDDADKVLSLPLTTEWKVRTGEGDTDFVIIDGGTKPPPLPGIEPDEVNLDNDAPALNEMAVLTNSLYGWTSVIGTHDLASGHGLCNDQPTGNLSTDLIAAFAYVLGPNPSGSAHPNLLGLQAYREPVAEELCSSLLGDSCSP